LQEVKQYINMYIYKNGKVEFEDIKEPIFAGSLCPHCQHLYKSGVECSAFPDGIPDYLLSGEQSHENLIKGQSGNTTFELKKEYSLF
jgi:hypothetical protein